MRQGDDICHGMVTIVRKNEGFIRGIPDDATICKVLFDEEWAPDYWYYAERELEHEEIPSDTTD